jgi:DNA methylase/ParB/Sulfiredoxin domain
MLQVQMVPIDQIKPNPRNARLHPGRQVRQLADSMKEFGCTTPVLIDEQVRLIAGHGRLAAAKLIGLQTVPAIMLRGLSQAKKRALALAENRIAEHSGWNREVLATELPELAELLVEEGLDISLTGFLPVEIDQLTTDYEEDPSDPDDAAELSAHPTVKPVALVTDAIKDCTRRGDVVLDTFCGSGTTILASERVGRRACALELEPRFVDVSIRRWQTFTRRDAVHADTGQSFDDLAAERLADSAAPASASKR